MADQTVAPPLAVRKLKLSELGVSGLNRWGGYVEEEFLPQLQGRRAVKVFREMSDNDAVIGAILFAIDMMLRQAEWRVEAGGSSYEDEAAAEFIEQAMDDMSHTWEELISEILSMLVFGWSWHEVVYKRRLGDSRNPMFKSKYTDGRIAWRKMPIRSQDTLHEWIFDDDGGIRGLYQLAPPDFDLKKIPITKSLLFRTRAHKNNPEGRSVLRNAYRSWFFLKRLQEVEGIGIERNIAGLPMGKIPSEYLLALHEENGDPEKQAVARAWLDMVRNVKRDEQEGLLIPSDIDEDSKHPLFSFELLSSTHRNTVDTGQVITRYEQRIAMTVLADFILLGHDRVGTQALSTTKTELFRSAMQSWLGAIAAVFNEHELPRLFELNGWKLKQLPRIVASDIQPPPLQELGQFISALSGSGMQLFPDEELENTLRSMARLPEKTDEAILEQEARRADPLSQLGGGMGPGSNGQPGQVPPDLLPFMQEEGQTGLNFGNGQER
jgi:hypothetical protein